MKLLEFINNLNQHNIIEGGNITLPTGETPDDLNLAVTKRSYIVPILNKLLADIDRLYQAQHKETLWSPKLLASKKFLSGSSLHFFNVSGISDDDFVRVKPKIGDIDTQIDVAKTDKLKSFLDSIQGSDQGDAKLLGYKSGNQQFSSLWQLKEPPIKIQIDLEFVDYEGDEPTEWSQFSHSSAWEDVQEGIKGVFHKFLISSIGSLSEKDFLLRKLVGRGKARAEQDVPTTDNMLSFAVSSKEGGGLRPKYAPVLDDRGEPLFKDGLPVMTALPASGYEKNILTIFQTLFGDRVGAKELAAMKNKLWSFVGLLDVMNMMLDSEEKQRVFDSFAEKLFGAGAQGLYKNDPERDSADKNSALNKIAKTLGIQISKELEQTKNDYYASYKMTGESITEAQAPSYKRQGIKHIYNRLPDGRVSSMEIDDKEFVNLAKKIQQDMGGKLKGAKINLKIDGAGIRFGKDQSGRAFMMTSKVDKPLYADDIGSFADFNKDKPEELQQRAAKYDRALDTIVNSDFIKVLPNDTIVQAEMLYNEMAEQTDDGLKFVNIPYDPKKLGSTMTLVPFMAKVYSTGETHPDEDAILDELNKKSSKDIKIMSNTLKSKDIDVSKIISPVVNLDPNLEAALAARGMTPEKEQANEIISKVKKQLSDFIIDNPNIAGKDQLGPNMEGLVINIPGLPPVKVTSQAMKAAMAAKMAPPPGADNQPTKTAVVALGSFVGHRGHEQLFKFVQDEAKAQGGDPFVFISQAVGKDDPIPGDMKLATWQRLYPNQKSVFSLVQDQPDGSRGSLIKKVEHELVKPRPGKLPDYNNIIIMVGSDRASMEKQATHLQSRLNRFPGYGKVKITLKTTPREAAAGGTGVTFTDMRSILKDPNATEQQQLATWMAGFNGAKLGEDWIKSLMEISRQNMGIKIPGTVESLDEEFKDAWNEYLLLESQSSDYIIKSITSTGDSIAKVYGDLKTMAEKWVYNNGQLKGFHRNAAGVGKRWYDTFYWGKMENDLRTLLEKNPRGAAKLQDFFNIERDDRGHVSFTAISKSLPKVLYQVGERIDSSDLKRFARNWFDRQNDYENFLSTVEKRINDDDSVEFTVPKKTPKDNLVGKQNSAAEEIVNQILKSIDRKVAGEIRNAIARETNKLQALQRELVKRNIKVGESIRRMKSQGVAEGFMDTLKGAAREFTRDSLQKKIKQAWENTFWPKHIEPALNRIQIDGQPFRKMVLGEPRVIENDRSKNAILKQYTVNIVFPIDPEQWAGDEIRYLEGQLRDIEAGDWNPKVHGLGLVSFDQPMKSFQYTKGPVPDLVIPVRITSLDINRSLVGEQGVAEGAKWRSNPDAHDINDDGDIYPKTRDMFAYDPLSRRQSTAGDARTARGRKSALKTSLKMAQGRHGPKGQLPEEQGVAEGSLQEFSDDDDDSGDGDEGFPRRGSWKIDTRHYDTALDFYSLFDEDYFDDERWIKDPKTGKVVAWEGWRRDQGDTDALGRSIPGELRKMGGFRWDDVNDTMEDDAPGTGWYYSWSPDWKDIYRQGRDPKGGVQEGDLDEDWRKKLAAAGMAGMMGLSAAAGAQDRMPEPVKEPMIATVVIDGEAKKLDLTGRGFDDVRDAERFLKKFMKDRGIIDWQAKIERSTPGSGKYQRVSITGSGGLESINNEEIRKVKGGYRLVSKKTGRNLGTYPTRARAEKRERQVQYFKHKGK